MIHWFEYELKHIDRTWNKQQWKAISHWLRECRRITEKAINHD